MLSFVFSNATVIYSKIVTVITEPALDKPLQGDPIVLDMKAAYDVEDNHTIQDVMCVFWKFNNRYVVDPVHYVFCSV